MICPNVRQNEMFTKSQEKKSFATGWKGGNWEIMAVLKITVGRMGFLFVNKAEIEKNIIQNKKNVLFK